MPRILNIVGCKNAGKTRTCEVLVPPLQALGLVVGTLKYTEHDGFDWDQPGKDTDRHRRAGSGVTGIFGARKFAFSLNNPALTAAPIDDLLRTFYRATDVVLLEGYLRDSSLKVEVCRPGYSNAPLCPPHVLLATYGENMFGHAAHHFAYGEEVALARFILDNRSSLRIV